MSRVAPNTPADKCNPRLNEGDQIVQINGHDVTHALHNTVVDLIQEARRNNGGKFDVVFYVIRFTIPFFFVSGKLILTVKPNVLYSGVEEYEEPPYQYVPVSDVLRPPSPGNALEQSMLLLADGLASGALVAQYDLLYRKHPDMSCDEAYKQKNVNKNRYRDISPCKFLFMYLKDCIFFRVYCVSCLL